MIRTRSLGFLCLAALPLTLAGCEAATRLPEDISTHGHEIDHLFWLIMWLTGITFVVTEALLVYAVIRFRHAPGRAAGHTHGNHMVEMVWTIVPGLILFFLAVYQIFPWRRAKIDMPKEEDSVQVRVLAKQFEWAFQYPGPDKRFDTNDDVFTLQDLVIPAHKQILVKMRSRDVLHSMFLPNLRFKQDTVPGTEITQWFQATKTTREARASRSKYHDDWPTWNYELACAELCGMYHQKMRATLTILDPKEFDEWIAKESPTWHPDKMRPLPLAFTNIDGERKGWALALSYGDPKKLYRQAGPSEEGFTPRKEKH